jgi:hypothetical protein
VNLLGWQATPAETRVEAVTLWQSRPVFITSSFQDMQAERDYLLLHVFPALEEWLATRRRHLEWVDLRVGVPNAVGVDEAGHEVTVLNVCLDEVKRSRPFMLGLLSDRYGSIPPAERIIGAAREAGISGDVVGRSVTDLEITYALLSDSGYSRRSLFFFRTPLPYSDMPLSLGALYSDAQSDDPQSADSAAKLRKLKDGLRTAVPDRCFDYEAEWDPHTQRVTNLDAWGRMVEQKLREALEAEIDDDTTPERLSLNEARAQALTDWIANCTRGFTGRAELLDAGPEAEEPRQFLWLVAGTTLPA